MKKVWMAAAILVLGLTFATSALAQWGPGWGRRGRGPGPCWMYGGPGARGGWANLTQGQVTSLGSLRQTFLTETADFRSGLMQKRLELQSLLVQPTPDAQEVVAKQKEMGDIASRLSEKRLLAQLEAQKLLTPEQIAQLPPGCTLGFGNLYGGFGPGFGRGYGRGMGSGRGWRQPGGWW